MNTTPRDRSQPEGSAGAAIANAQMDPTALGSIQPPSDEAISPSITAILAAQGFHPGSDVLRGKVSPWFSPFLRVESAMEWLANRLKRLAMLELIQIVATFWIAVGAYQYLAGRKAAEAARVKESHYAAWQVINSAQGKGGFWGQNRGLARLSQRQGLPGRGEPGRCFP
jgi:hypothetical protein